MHATVCGMHWLIDPVEHTLEVYQLEAGAWIEVGRFTGVEQVVAPPFEAVSFGLEVLWTPWRPTLV